MFKVRSHLRRSEPCVKPSSSCRRSSTYDDMVSSNLHPVVMEDESLKDNNSLGEQQLSEHAIDMSLGLSGWDKFQGMRTQVTRLQEQLSQKDSALADLQKQLEEERTAHQRLKKRWSIVFWGTSSCKSSSSMSSSSSRRLEEEEKKEEEEGPTKRYHEHVDQLEEENAALTQKTMALSVALAASKAKSSHLESRLEESLNIIKLQNSFPIGFSRASSKRDVTAGDEPLGMGRRLSQSVHGFKNTLLSKTA